MFYDNYFEIRLIVFSKYLFSITENITKITIKKYFHDLDRFDNYFRKQIYVI